MSTSKPIDLTTPEQKARHTAMASIRAYKLGLFGKPLEASKYDGPRKFWEWDAHRLGTKDRKVNITLAQYKQTREDMLERERHRYRYDSNCSDDLCYCEGETAHDFRSNVCKSMEQITKEMLKLPGQEARG